MSEEEKHECPKNRNGDADGTGRRHCYHDDGTGHVEVCCWCGHLIMRHGEYAPTGWGRPYYLGATGYGHSHEHT